MDSNRYIDEYGVIYSSDRRTLIKVDKSIFCVKEYSIPEGTTHIMENAFLCCETLERLYVPDSVVLEEGCLCECAKNLKYARLSSNIKYPDIALFYGCESLEEVILPEGIEGIGENMFTGCISLKSVHLPSSIRYFQSATFCGSGLEEITLPEGLEQIGRDTFVTCRSLKSITIPRGVKKIGPWFVQGHAGFEGVESLSPHYRVESECLISNDDDGLIACWSREAVWHVPKSVRNIYSICNDQIETIVIDNDIKEIGYDAFCACPNLKEVIINAQVQEINDSYGCEHIKITNITFKRNKDTR